jgi:hypothetical protein
MITTTATNKNRNRFGKFAVAATSAMVGAVCAGLATYALFTTSTTATSSVGSGTLTVALGTPGAANRLNVSASNIAAGDTMQRAFDLSNSGSLALSASPTLTTSASPSTLLDTDATNGLQMVIDKCSTAWTESGSAPAYTYTCSGTTTSVLASRAVTGSAISLSNITDLIPAGTTDHLRLTLTLPSAAGNTFEGLTSTITYSFAATQRSATNQ